MISHFKNRGHFCNYCRKILSNKCPQFHHHIINPTIWRVWDTADEGVMHCFISDLCSTEYAPDIPHSVRKFHNQLRQIATKYAGERGA